MRFSRERLLIANLLIQVLHLAFQFAGLLVELLVELVGFLLHLPVEPIRLRVDAATRMEASHAARDFDIGVLGLDADARAVGSHGSGRTRLTAGRADRD